MRRSFHECRTQSQRKEVKDAPALLPGCAVRQQFNSAAAQHTFRVFGLKTVSEQLSERLFVAIFHVYAKKHSERSGKMEARDLILQADAIARKKGMTQAQWSSLSGYASNGQTVSRILNRGECKLSTIVALLDTVGCELQIVNKG